MIKTHDNSWLSKLHDSLPLGMKNGGAKTALYHRLAKLVLSANAPHLKRESIQKISNTAQKIKDYTARSESLRGSFWKAAERHTHKVLSIVSENVSIFAAAAAGSIAGPIGAIIGTTATTWPQSYGHSILDSMFKQGVDTTDPNRLQAALADTRFFKSIHKKALTRAFQTSGVVLAAGLFASYAHNFAAEPVATTSAAMLRNPAFSKIAGEITEKSAIRAGELIAIGAKSATNSMAKNIGLKATERVIAASLGTKQPDMPEARHPLPPYLI